MRYYDIHTHQPSLHPEDIAILSVDIRKTFVPGTRRVAVGVHPWYISYNDTETTEQLFEKVRGYSLLPDVVAIGETGLDKMTAKTTNDYQFQQVLFSSHALLAEKVKKTLIIHCVKAWDDLLRIRQSIKPSVPWIVHGFRGKEPLASRLLNAGFYLSFGQHYNLESLKAAWTNNRLLAETDDNQINIREVYHQMACDLHISEQLLSNEIEGKIELIFNFQFSIFN